MTAFRVGDVVTVISLGRNRKITAISEGRALCKAFTGPEEDWYPFWDLRPDDSRPLQPIF